MSTTSPTPPARIEGWELLDLLTSLVQKSLVVYEEDEQGRGRYRLLETVRQYARDRLLETGEAEAVRGRHLDCFMRLAEQAEPELVGPQHAAWLDRLERELDNFRAALVWCQSEDSSRKPVGSLDQSLGAPDSARHDQPLPAAGCLLFTRPEAGLRLGGALWKFWGERGHQVEGREHLAALLALPGAEARTAARAKALRWVGSSWITARGGEYGAARARQRLEESLAISRELGDKRGIALSLRNLGRLQEDYEAARALLEESLALSWELGSKWDISWSLKQLSNVAIGQGDYGTARALLEESLAIDREAGDDDSIAWSLHMLGDVAYARGDYGAARPLLEESLAIFRGLVGHHDDFEEYAQPWTVLGLVPQNHGGELLGNKGGIAWSIRGLGFEARERGDYGAARALFEESLAIFRELGDKSGSGVAWTLHQLGSVTRDQGDHRAARVFHEESLVIRRELGDQQGIVTDLEGLAAVAVARGQTERAARLFGAAEGLREALGAPLPAADRAEHERCAAAVRIALGEAAFAAAWAEGRAMPLEAAVAFALDATPGAEG